MVTLPDFWPTIHAGDVRIVRDNLSTVTENMLLLESGTLIQTDFMVMCTGWGDHFAMFDDETKAELGLPTYNNNNNNQQPSPSSSCLSAVDDIRWDQYDEAADKYVNERLPFLAQAPTSMNAHTNDVQPHRRWRLYRRSIPMQLALKNDRSLAIMGQIHTVQTPLVADIQSFWTILYLLGELDLPHKDTMAREIAEWNAWTRKRYLSQGEKFPYSLYDFLPVSTTSFIELLLLSLYVACSAGMMLTTVRGSISILCAKISVLVRVAKAMRSRSFSSLISLRTSEGLWMSIWLDAQGLRLDGEDGVLRWKL